MTKVRQNSTKRPGAVVFPDQAERVAALRLVEFFLNEADSNEVRFFTDILATWKTDVQRIQADDRIYTDSLTGAINAATERASRYYITDNPGFQPYAARAAALAAA